MPRMNAKKIYLGISAEGQWQKHEMQVALKKVYWKNKSVPNIWAILPLKKGILSELNKCTFQISLKYIKLVFKSFYKVSFMVLSSISIDML